MKLQDNHQGVAMKIDKNIPMPTPTRGTTLDVVTQLEIGDSVFFDDRVLAQNFAQAFRKFGRKATTRKVEGGVRVWRVE